MDAVNVFLPARWTPEDIGMCGAHAAVFSVAASSVQLRQADGRFARPDLVLAPDQEAWLLLWYLIQHSVSVRRLVLSRVLDADATECNRRSAFSTFDSVEDFGLLEPHDLFECVVGPA